MAAVGGLIGGIHPFVDATHFVAMPWDEIKMQPGLGHTKIRRLMEMFAAALD